jgi:hypothetical protein
MQRRATTTRWSKARNVDHNTSVNNYNTVFSTVKSQNKKSTLSQYHTIDTRSFSTMVKKCCASCCGGPAHQVRADDCMCGCGYLNGPFQIMLGQLFLLCGCFFSLAAMGDCAFVETAIPVTVYTTIAGEGFTRSATRLGFFMYENETGYCYYWTDGYFATVEEQIQYYINNVLGNGWFASINMASTAVCVAFLFFLYVTSYCCSAQIRPFRFTTGFFIGIVLVVFQGLTFLVYQSEWCDIYQCSFGRSAGFSVGAAVCFLLSGIMWCMTSDYPGEEGAAAFATDNNKSMDGAEQGAVEVEHGEEPSYAVTGTEGQNQWQTY